MMDLDGRERGNSNGLHNASEGSSETFTYATIPVPEFKYPGDTPILDNDYGISIDAPIVIDNGSCRLRAGFGSQSEPYLSIPNLASKYRERKSAPPVHLIGNNVFYDTSARLQAKSPFDGGIVTNVDIMESMLEYVFHKLNITEERGLIMTEPIANPSFYRNQISELLFEGFNIKDLTVGIDALWSFYNGGGRDGIVVSMGHSATHVLPVIDGIPRLIDAKRYEFI